MTFAWTLLAIIAPAFAGIAVVWRLRDRETNIAWTLGAGWFLGQVMVMLAIYSMFMISGSAHARWIVGAMLIIAAAVILSGFFSNRNSSCQIWRSNSTIPPVEFVDSAVRPRFGWKHVLFAAIIVSLTIKLCILIAAHFWIPVRGDDAISIWLFKAKVIAGLDALPRDPPNPYYLGGSHANYPVFLPLLSAWIPLVTGQWNEYAATWPWLGFYISLPLVIAGGLRRWLGSTSAWMTAYLAASLPLLVVHVYRPGYADLPMAVFLTVAVISFLTWRSTSRLGNLSMAMIFLLTTALMKREGPPIAAVVFLAMVSPSWATLRQMSKAHRAWFFGMTLIAALLVTMAVGMSDVSENVGQFGYHAEVWQAFIRHLLSWSSFHFLFWLIPVALIGILLRNNGAHRTPALLLFAGLFLLDAAIFLLTPQARFALNDQTLSRVFLQSAPAWITALSIPLNTAWGGGKRL